MSETRSNKFNKIQATLLTLVSIPCVLFAAFYFFDETYRQWSMRFGWASMHNAHGAFLIVVIAWVLSAVLLLIVGVWWADNSGNKLFPHRAFAVWVALLSFGATVYLPSDQQYGALAVIVLGPGVKSVEFQKNAVIWDSAVLIKALLLRGANVDQSILCSAVKQNSLSVVSLLTERGGNVNDCPS